MGNNEFLVSVNDLVCKILKSSSILSPVSSIIVEGYDCVGKGRLIDELSSKLNMPVYHPDYSFLHDRLPREYRGLVNWSYFDIMRVVYPPDQTFIKDPVIFDRGMVSAAVYNEDPSLLDEYSKKIEGYNVIHILVTARDKDYIKYAELRGEVPDVDKYYTYTGRFYEYLESYDLKYFVFVNPYDDEYAASEEVLCDDCKNYNFPNCLHPKIADMRSPSNPSHCKYYEGQ